MTKLRRLIEPEGVSKGPKPLYIATLERKPVAKHYGKPVFRRIEEALAKNPDATDFE